MPFNLLLFPLVGGYFILTNFKYFKYIQYRLESQRLLLNSALIGIFLLLFTFIVRITAELLFPDFIHLLHAYLPVKTAYFGTTSFSLIIAILSTVTANIFINTTTAVKYAIKFAGNELEVLLKTAMLDNKLLQFSLDTGKFYIGWLKELPVPFKSNYIRIVPVYSGYRDEKKELVFTTQYLSVYASYIEEGSINSIDELNTDLVIKADAIKTVGFFDLEMYNRFNSGNEQ